MVTVTYGVDLAKSVFHVHGADQKGKTTINRRFSRNQLKQFFANCYPALVGMEACGGSHYWAGLLSGYGHRTKLISPQFVKPYLGFVRLLHASPKF